MPNIFVLSGPNGAGKTTSAMALLPKKLNCVEFVNADVIAAGLSPFCPTNVAIEAGRLMINRLKKLSCEKKDFAFETTLASKSFAAFLKSCKKNGYTTSLLYLWLSNSELAIKRVRLRVASGGHDIPENVIRRRYVRSILNLIHLYLPIVTNCFIFDNSTGKPQEIAKKENNGQIIILDKTKWDTLRNHHE